MAIFLERVPLEIRNQIYEELLISREHAIKLRLRKAPNHKHPNKIQSAVLRTCKQIYDEASIVLFEHNRFRFTSYTPSWLNYLKDDPSYKNLNRIKHVRTTLSLFLRTNFGDHCDQLDLVHCGETKDALYHESKYGDHRWVDKFTTIMMFLVNAGCSLQTLRLHFCFWELTFPSQNTIHYDDYNHYTRVIIKAAKASNYRDPCWNPIHARYVQDKIDHTLDNFREEYNRTIEEFTNRVNMAKERALMVDIGKGSTKEDGELLDMWTKFGQMDSQFGSRYFNGKCHYEWTWTLTPLSNRSHKRFPTPWQSKDKIE